MRPWNSVMIATVAAASVGIGPRASVAAPPANEIRGYELSHVIPFEVGDIQLRDGDNITINEVRGTADTVSAGNSYVVKGTYRLSSEKGASLAVYTTVNARDPEAMKTESIPTQRTQIVEVEQGSGHFSLILYMWCEGNPHVSFYHAGPSIGGVYFGTGKSVLHPTASTTRASVDNGSSSKTPYEQAQIDDVWRQADAVRSGTVFDPKIKAYANELEAQLFESQLIRAIRPRLELLTQPPAAPK